jgi:phytoene dehydrogenase-like protein
VSTTGSQNGKAYDVVVIGAGVNGLVCASYLAKRGKSVLVVEKNGFAGGLAAGREFHPGFRSPGVLHDVSGLRGWVVEELGLKRHGLAFRTSEAPVFAPAPAEGGGRGLLLWRDPARAAEDIGPLSQKDAKAYVDYRAFIERAAPVLRKVFDDVAPDVTDRSLPGLWDFAKKALKLRMLGKGDMMEMLRVPPMCVADWLNEWFETDLLKAALAQPSLWASWTGPWSPGTAANLLLDDAFKAPDIVGGPQALVKALVACAESHGVTVRTNAAVARIDVQDGTAKGVVLASGETIGAARVAASVDPKSLFLKMVDGTRLTRAFRHDITQVRARGTSAKVHLALKAYPEFGCRPSTKAEHVRTGDFLDQLERAFDAVKYRQMSESPLLDLYFPTLDDPSMAPQGQHVASVLVHFAPEALEGGWTVAAKEKLYKATLASLARYAPSAPSLVVGYEVLTPGDLAAEFGLSGGHLYHGEHAADQLFARPTPACARYETPIAGLFLCGGGAHPGGGITGAPGAFAARVIGG